MLGAAAVQCRAARVFDCSFPRTHDLLFPSRNNQQYDATYRCGTTFDLQTQYSDQFNPFLVMLVGFCLVWFVKLTQSRLTSMEEPSTEEMSVVARVGRFLNC